MDCLRSDTQAEHFLLFFKYFFRDPQSMAGVTGPLGILWLFVSEDPA